jgi:hypothetical protein
MPGQRLATRLIGALCLLALAGLAAPALGGNVPLREVPKPVLDAVRARFKDARITGADREREGGTWVYEVSIKHQGRNIDVTLTPEGAILLIKTEVAATDLPEPAARALAANYPGATYRAVEEVITVQGGREELAYYEIELVTARRRTLDVRVSVDGRILKEER